MFEQHPVPQNISSYQFHLVGDMTLKQFLELAAGVVVGVLIYATSLPGFIKWPLILFSVLLGAALAFVPFEERPLEQWIVAFFRSVYSPTLFHWEKQENIKYFADEESTSAKATADTPKPMDSAFARIPFLNKLEETENSYLSKLAGLFNPSISLGTSPSTNITGANSQVSNQQVIIQPQTQENSAGSVLTMDTQTDIAKMTQEAKKEVQIPQSTFVSMDKSVRPQFTVEEIPQNGQKVDTTLVTINPTLSGQAVNNARSAVFSTQAAPPSLPTIVNTVSGQVMDTTGNIVEGAILEIRDMDGRPVRALRTNKAGHFLIVTALTNGKYNIHTEKEGLSFDPIEFEATGAIIEPIAIRATI